MTPLQVLVGNDEMLSSLRAIRAAEVSLRNNGYVLTGRCGAAHLRRRHSWVTSAATTAALLS